MRLLRGLYNPGIQESGSVATIGNFDGVHLGHQAILKRVVAKANELGLPSVLMVFEPQPHEFFSQDDAPPRLMRFAEKYAFLESLGLDYLSCVRFDEKFSHLSADEFIDDVLIEHLRTKHLIVGDDFRFGGDRQGDFKHLVQAGEKKGFDVERTLTLIAENTGSCAGRISSTSIRQALSEARFDDATALLGRPYSITGRVVYGQQLGRTLGFPTANITLKRRICALQGVYAVRLTRADGTILNGVANVGRKPSVGQFEPNVEVHVFDFSGDLYGEKVSVEFCTKIRDEQRFDGVEKLKAAIEQDVLVAKKYF